MTTESDMDRLRETIRSCAFDLKLPLVRRDIDLLIQQSADEQWSLWQFTAELLRREKENRTENQRRHRIKKRRVPAAALSQRDRHRRPSGRCTKGAPGTRDA